MLSIGKDWQDRNPKKYNNLKFPVHGRMGTAFMQAACTAMPHCLFNLEFPSQKAFQKRTSFTEVYQDANRISNSKPLDEPRKLSSLKENTGIMFRGLNLQIWRFLIKSTEVVYHLNKALNSDDFFRKHIFMLQILKTYFITFKF